MRAYEELKSLIIANEYKAGSDLDETELVNRFKVSRTPIREALIRLSMEGLVTMTPSRGAKVSNLNFSDITEHLEIMDILTPSICFLAALRRTDQDLDDIMQEITRLNAADQDDLRGRLDAIFCLYTALGKATHNESLEHIYRLTIYAKLRIGRISASRLESKEEWSAHVEELRKVYSAIYKCIAERNADGAHAAACDWMKIVRERLSSVVSSSTHQAKNQLLGR